MANKEIVLKIKNEAIWFNESNYIDIKQTNIPCKHLSFKTYKGIFWKVQLKNYENNSGKLTVEISLYECDDMQSFQNQKPKAKISFLEFESFNWEYLEPLLSWYKKSEFDNLLTNVNKNYSEEDQYTIHNRNGSNNNEPEIVKSSQARQPFITELEEEFSVNINDCVFRLGCVRFSKKVKCLKQILDFEIKNENILPEFDNIKYWFSKKLKTKKFRVKAIFTQKDYVLSDYSATSKEIDLIDQEFIDGVKIQRTLGLTKYIRPQEIDKALFTSDDVYSLDNENDGGGNVFKQKEKEIVEILIGKSEVRNKNQLIYLSGKKQSLNYRIRFTNHPNFGFIFLTEGEKHNHFIWELLNSHATYVWSIEKNRHNIEWQFKRMDDIINKILQLGREQYKLAYKNRTQDEDLLFNVVKHNQIGSNFLDGFPKWKYRLNELLT